MQAKNHTGLRVGTRNIDILRMALPISLAMLIPQINFVTNTIFLSYNETVLAAAGITGVFYLIFALVGNGLNSGLQGLLSRRAGENRPAEIGKVYIQGLWIALFYAIGGILLTYSLGPYLLTNALQSAEIRELAIEFLFIRVWGIPFLYLFQMSNALLVGTNNSRYMKYGFWTMAGLNILLDYGLIYGKLGMPELGFNGAAWASVIAEISGVIVVFALIIYNKFHTRFSLFSALSFRKKLAGLIFFQSLPLVLQWLLSIIAWMVFYIFIEHLGERELAISNTMRTIFGTVGIFAWAFASTANAMVSNVIGQDKKEIVLALINKIMLLSLCFTFLLCVLINIFPNVFLSIYTNDPTFIEEAMPVLRLITAGIMLMSISTVWLNAVTGTGNTRINLMIEIIAIILYSLYIYFVIKVWKLGLVWAWGSELLYWATLFLLSYGYLQSGRWKNKVI